ncbi:MAG: CDP-alcohol phosphatidyltransferase family protein [Acidobacteriota bacterium]
MSVTRAVIESNGPSGEVPDDHYAFAGLPLVERAVLTAAAAGLRDIVVAGVAVPDPAIRRRLSTRGIEVQWTPDAWTTAVPETGAAVVWNVATIVEPEVIDRLRAEGARVGAAGSGAPCVVDFSSGEPVVLAVGRSALAGIAEGSVTAAARTLARAGSLRPVDAGRGFARRVHSTRHAAELERAFIRRLNGSEYALTKVLRRQSVHLTRALVRTPLGPNAITVLSLLVSVAAAGFLGLPGYWTALLGAALYYLSTLLDCCDGEVARCTFRTSAFGCWLETFSDYVSTVLILGAVLLRVVAEARSELDVQAAGIAVWGTLITIALLAYQRHRVAGHDPDAYERIFKSRLGGASSGLVGRAVVWSLQFIKRACVAHVLLALAAFGQTRMLVYLWAFAVILAVPVSLGVHLALVGRPRTVSGGRVAKESMPS